MSAQEYIEMGRQADGYWHWRYIRRGEDGVEIALPANLEYGDREQARHSAAAAYPDVPIHAVAPRGRPEEGGPRRGPRRFGRRLTVFLAALLVRRIVRRVLRRLCPPGGGREREQAAARRPARSPAYPSARARRRSRPAPAASRARR